MADIISFHAAASRVPRSLNAAAYIGGPAQLLFFTGVRYERASAEVKIDVQKKPRKRKTITAQADAAIGS